MTNTHAFQQITLLCKIHLNNIHESDLKGLECVPPHFR